MIVNDFNLKSIAFIPFKAHAVLLIDSNTVLADPITLERFKPQADATEIVERSGLVEEEKSTKSDALKCLKARHAFLIEEFFGVAIRKAPYQSRE